MHAMILDEKLNFVWAEVTDPKPREGEVLLRVHAAAVNRADLMQKDGCYASPEGWPQWCGLEVSGEIVTAPTDSGFKAGDRVCALLGGGGYSELVTVPAGMVIPIPEGLSMIEAASLPEVWSTVYLNLEYEAGGLKKDDVFYMQAGASGVGLAAIQYAKLSGATVITTIDSPEKASFVKKNWRGFRARLPYRGCSPGDRGASRHRCTGLHRRQNDGREFQKHGIRRPLDYDRHNGRCGNLNQP